MVVRRCVILTGTRRARASTIRRLGAAASETSRAHFNCFSTSRAALAHIAASALAINFVVSILSYPALDRSRHVNVLESWFFGNVYTHTPSNAPVCVT
jgi:hypothetical protein